MVIGLAITLIVVVVAGMVVVVSYDVSHGPQRPWHQGLKEWQQLIGAVLGLLAAAGVFILGTEIQAEQSRQQAFGTQRSIGLGLALEAERLSQGLRAGQLMAESMTFDGSDGDARRCHLFMTELTRYLPPKVPVYEAVLDRIADFGAQNLSWFVSFHGVYADIVRALELSQSNACSVPAAQADVGYVATLIGGALNFYNEIAKRYGTTPIATTEQIEEQLQAPAPPPATAPAATTAN